MIPPQAPSGNLGSGSEPRIELGRSTRGRSRWNAAATAVPTVTAASGAGIARSCLGSTLASRDHSRMIAIVTIPTSVAALWLSMICPGSVAMLSRAWLSGSPPSTTCNCPKTMVSPIPPSMPCTIAGETATAARATRLTANRICTTPAATVTAQVTRHP